MKKSEIAPQTLFKRSGVCYNGQVRYLGIDYGDRRVGVAASDSGVIADGLYAFEHTSMRQAIDRVAEEARRGADLIVVGLPLNMDGSEGERAQKTRAFGRVLQRVAGVEVVFTDERLTSIEAESLLIEGGVRRETRKNGLIDKLSAQLILQSYLDKQNNKIPKSI